MKLDSKAIGEITRQVYLRFPEMKGCNPIVQLQTPHPSKTYLKEPTYVITYHTNAKPLFGTIIPRRVRVVTNNSGKILKMSTSR